MIIDRVETFVVGVPEPFEGGLNWLFVKLTTDDGIEGWGECNGCTYREATLEKMVHELCGHFILGRQNPFDLERLWGRLYSGDDTADVKVWSNFRRSGSFAMQALAAIDMACWDIMGKTLGQPVYNLIGGKYREELRSYTYILDGWKPGDPPEVAAQAAASLCELGFTAFKLDPIPPYFPQAREISLNEIRYAVSVFEAIRAEVGDHCDIILGTHGQLNTQSAIRLAKAVEPLSPMWFEEPVPPEDATEMARVAQSTSIPVATGERLSTRWDFRDILEKKAAQVIQINVGLNGILESKKIAAIAESYYAQIAPWVYCGPVAASAAIHVDVSTPNFLIQEGIKNWAGFTAEVMRTPVEWKNGFIIPSSEPGLGADLDEAILKRHPRHDYTMLKQIMGKRKWRAEQKASRAPVSTFR